jgi:hypothetical protein
MSAEIRITLSDDLTAMLDGVRLPATRTAFAAYLLEDAIRRKRREHESGAPSIESAKQDGEQQ